MRYSTPEERFFARLVTLTQYEARVRRNLMFDIDVKFLVSLWNQQQGLCALTVKPMSFAKGSTINSRTNPDVCTMDRIEPSQGYIKGNIQLTRWLPNRVKINLSAEEFLDLCKSVVDTAKTH